MESDIWVAPKSVVLRDTEPILLGNTDLEEGTFWVLHADPSGGIGQRRAAGDLWDRPVGAHFAHETKGLIPAEARDGGIGDAPWCLRCVGCRCPMEFARAGAAPSATPMAKRKAMMTRAQRCHRRAVSGVLGWGTGTGNHGENSLRRGPRVASKGSNRPEGPRVRGELVLARIVVAGHAMVTDQLRRDTDRDISPLVDAEGVGEPTVFAGHSVSAWLTFLNRLLGQRGRPEAVGARPDEEVVGFHSDEWRWLLR